MSQYAVGKQQGSRISNAKAGCEGRQPASPPQQACCALYAADCPAVMLGLALPCLPAAGERQQQVAGELEREFQSGLRRMQQANRTGGLGL